MPTGKANDGRHGGSGNRRFRYKQLLIEQGVEEKAAHKMAKEKYSDMSLYKKSPGINTPLTSSELVDMKKAAERQASPIRKANAKSVVSSSIRGSGSGGSPGPTGSGGMNPIDIEKVPGKRPLKMKDGGDPENKKTKVRVIPSHVFANKYAKGLGGRLSLSKEIAKNLELEGYLDGSAVKPKGGPSKAEITGGGIKVTKRFNKGGKVATRGYGIARKPTKKK